MASQELFQLITRTNSCFRTVNLKNEYTLDPFSGSNKIRKSDPGFTGQSSTGVCFKNGKLQVCKKHS
jgi:hypothetical protein